MSLLRHDRTKVPVSSVVTDPFGQAASPGKGPGTVGEQPQARAHDRQVLQHCNHLLLTLGRVDWYRGAASLEAICPTLGWDRYDLAALANMALAWGTRSLRHPSGTTASPSAVEPGCWTDRMQVPCQCSTRPGAHPPWWATSRLGSPL